MCANVTLPLALVSNKLNVPVFSTVFQWDKIYCNCYQVYYEETVLQLSVNFGNPISPDSQEPNQYPGLSVISVY